MAGNTGASGSTGATGPLGTAGGDLSGTYPNPTVVGLQTYPISNTAPATNNILEFTGGKWTPTNPNGLFWELAGNTGTTPSSSPIGTAVNNNFIGTTDARDYVLATNNLERMRITSGGNIGVGTTTPSTLVELYQAANDILKITSSYGGAGNHVYIDLQTYGTTTGVMAKIGAIDMGGYNGSIVFETNNAGVANGATTTERMRITNTGYVGIGTATPYGMLHVITPSMSGASIPTWTNGEVVIGLAGQSGTASGGLGLSYDSTNAVGTIYSISPGSAWRDLAFRNNNTIFYYGGGTEGMRQTNTGALSFGGAANYGTSGQVLTSNGNGPPSWQKPATNAVYGVLGSGVNVPYNTASYLYTGSNITLPPGTYVVFVNMLMSTGANTTNNSSFWLRTTFGDASTSTTPTGDIVGSSLASGNLPGSSFFTMINGSIVIKNSTGANKTYYYLAGECQANNNTSSLTNFGDAANAENAIFAFELQ